MSSFPSCQDHDHHPLDLLDEYWFFSNTLNINGKKKKPPPALLPSGSPATTAKPQQGHQGSSLGCRRRLLRTPSLPPPRIPAPNDDDDDKEELVVVEEEVDDDDLNWSSIYEGIVRARITTSGRPAALQRAPSMPVVPSSDHSGRRRNEKEMPLPATASNSKQLRQQRSCSTLLEETPTNSKQQQQGARNNKMMVRSRSTVFHQADDKKTWKSSSDLESIEVQGFKDLGFVFDREELRQDLADVLPGLNSKNHQHGDVRRPYLSEAWQHDRRPPALIRVQSEARSAAEMKDRLRMWAQAVACNLRQDCA